LQRQYRYVLFVLVSLISFSFYYFFIDLPNKTLSILSIVILVTYPWWRRSVPTPNLSTYLLYLVTSFWLYEAWYRLENSLLISNRYYSDIPPKPVDFETALLGAGPFMIVALVLLIDELFIVRPIQKYFYNIDMLNAENINRRKKAISKILADGNKMIFYSKSGVKKAKELADTFSFSHKNILFYSEKEIDKQMKHLINLSTKDKLY